MWHEIFPKDQNGKIVGYTVFYNVKDQSARFSLNTTVTTATIRGLKPYTTYCIKVAGYTRVGLSPLKDGCYYVRTLQSGTVQCMSPLQYMYLSCYRMTTLTQYSQCDIGSLEIAQLSLSGKKLCSF